MDTQYMKVGRLVTSKNNINFQKLLTKLAYSLEQANVNLTYFILPGGFIEMDLENRETTISDFEEDYIKDKIKAFFEEISTKLWKNISKRVKFFSIGIDGFFTLRNKREHPIIQSVVLFSTTLKKIVKITGKSYPTVYEAAIKIQLYPLESHFYTYYSDKILLLGCHDLKLFSARSIKTAKGYRKKTLNKFQELFKKHNPNIILHHPHVTNKYRTWNNEWRYLDNLDTINHFSSGIYYEAGEDVDINIIIKKSQSENVFTLRY